MWNRALALLAVLCVSAPAWADLQVTDRAPDTAGRDVGLGLIAGDPTALSLKAMLGGHHALQVHAGWRIGPADGGRLTLTGDYLHQFVLVDPGAPTGQLSPYVGVGGKISAGDGREILGARLPLGLSWFFGAVPIELGLEIAPGVAVLPGPGLMVDGGLVARYWF